MSLLKEALDYAKRGWPVILTYGLKNGVCTCSDGSKCQHPGKHAIPGCSQKDATTDPDIIDKWIIKTEKLCPNIGILTGTASGLIVLDIDVRHDGDESLRLIQESKGALPITLVAKTGGGGEHYYFKHPGNLFIRTSIGSIGPGIDVKADSGDGKLSGYVLAPPSVTSDVYEWRNKNLPIASPPDWLLNLIVFEEEERSARFEAAQEIVEGHRHDFLLSRAGKLRHDNWSYESILQALVSENKAKCRPPLDESEVERIAKDIIGYDSPLFRLDDIGNAKRLVYRFGAQLRHCWQQNTWYIWEGRYWSRDTIGQLQQFAKSTVEWMHEDASLKGGDVGPKLRKHAATSGRIDRIKAMIEVARSEQEICVNADDLDHYPLLLNCPNGTLDLETQKLRSHDPKSLITKITTTDYNENARSSLWETFLKETTNDDEELQLFLQRISGYALSGLTIEENIFFVHGPGGTGKSTYFETIKAVMGDAYCKTASFSTFLKSKNPGGNAARSDIARLAGARLVTAVETEEGKQFAADLLKISTGGDKIVTRNLYQSEFEFTPQYKIWLAANAKPRVRDDDSGIWRRLLLIPFYHVVQNQNKKLKETLKHSKKDREGVLAWAVKGFTDWQKFGWTVPSVVLKETKNYKSEMDSVNAWMEDCCQTAPGQYVILKALWESYDEWMQKQSHGIKESRIETTKAFAVELQKRGLIVEVKNINGRATKVFNGLAMIY